jgi:hypothetical protein
VKHKDKDNLAQMLSEALDQGSKHIDPQLKPWLESLNVMKELFEKLPTANLSKDSQDKLFEIIEEAWMACFEDNPQERQKHIEQLYHALIKVPLSEFSTTMHLFQNWIKTQKDALSEADLFAGLQVYARIAHECDETDFISAFQEDELPPISLTQDEMEMLNGGVRLVQIKRALLQIPNSFRRIR